MDNAKLKYLFWMVMSLLSGTLLMLAAIPSKFWYVNFVAFVPLLFVVEFIVVKKKAAWHFLLQLILVLCVFFIGVGFWILQTANVGFLLGIAIIFPFIVLLLPYIYFLKKKRILAYSYFIAAWLAVEYFQNYYKLGSSFFNLGNSLGACPEYIQWYSYTGAAGGSLWILVVNFLLFSILKNIQNFKKKNWCLVFVLVFVLLSPVLTSKYIYSNYNEKGKPREVLVVHPCTDNTNVKYQTNIFDLLDIYLNIALPEISQKTDYVVLPETAITNTGWVEDYNRNLVFQHWYNAIADFPNLKLITGAIAYEKIPNVETIKNYDKIPGIRYSTKYKKWYRTYNAALQLDAKLQVQMRVKEGLVPFQEYAPYPQLLPRLLPVGIDFQFSDRVPNRKVFVSVENEKVAPIICYETVFGRYFAQAVKSGAEAFFVLLNEGWYQNSKVSKQFLQFSVIRAIENRRSVVHCSNLGISAFINQRGDVDLKIDDTQATCIKSKILLNKTNTLSVMLGNYIGVIALIFVSLILVGWVVLFFLKIRGCNVR